MAKTSEPFKDFPNCQNCVTFDCLQGPQFQNDLTDWASMWKKGARRMKALAKEPSPLDKIWYLQEVKPEELTDFFIKHCQGWSLT